MKPAGPIPYVRPEYTPLRLVESDEVLARRARLRAAARKVIAQFDKTTKKETR